MRSRDVSTIVIGAALAIIVVAPAEACRFGRETFYLSTTVPLTRSTGAFVAEVEVVRVELVNPGRYVIEATVRTIISGHNGIEKIRIEPPATSSCDQIPNVGDHGIVAGAIWTSVDGVAVVDPVRSQGFWSDNVFPPAKQFGVGRIGERKLPQNEGR